MALPLAALAPMLGDAAKKASAILPAAIQSISGLFQIGRGKRLAKQNPFVNEAVNENIVRNVAEAENMARQGMPSQQYNDQLQSIQKNQAGGVRLLNRSTNPSAGVASLVRAGNEATGTLNANNAQQRIANQRFAIGQRGILANEQNRVWDWNKRQRYLQNAQAAAQTLNAGRQNLFGGLQSLAQIGMMGGGSGSQSGGGSSGMSSSPNFGGMGFNMPSTPSLNSSYNPSQYNLSGGRPPMQNFNFGIQ